MDRYFDLVGNTLFVIFVDQLSGTSIFRRRYSNKQQLDDDFGSIVLEDLIECFDRLKKAPEWRVVLLEDVYTLDTCLTRGNVF